MKFIKPLETIIVFLGSAMLFLMMVVTFLDVIGRSFLNRPLIGASELTEIAMTSLVFFLLPSVSLRQEHISVELIDSFSGYWLNLIRDFLTCILGFAFFAMMAWRLFVNAGRAQSYGDATINLGISIAPILYGMSVMAALSAIIFLVISFKVEKRHTPAEMKVEQQVAEIVK